MSASEEARATREYVRLMLPLRRRILANLLFLRAPFRNYLPLFVLLLLVMVAGGVLFHELYDQRPLGLPEALFVTFSLLFMENTVGFPDQWVLRALMVVLPVLGLVVILDGLARFGYHILRRDEHGKAWVHAMSRTLHDHVILFGLGRVGFRVLQQLIHLKEAVVVVEKDPHCPNIAFAKNHGVTTLIGTGREHGLLDDVNLTRAKSMILATDDDLANLELAIDAKIAKPDIRILLRLYDQELASKVRESFGIQMAFSTSELCAPLFATASSDSSIQNAFYAGDRLLVVAELRIDERSEFHGRTVAEVGKNNNAFLVAIERPGETARFYPPATQVLQTGDRVTVQCEPETLKVLHQKNRNGVVV